VSALESAHHVREPLGDVAQLHMNVHPSVRVVGEPPPFHRLHGTVQVQGHDVVTHGAAQSPAMRRVRGIWNEPRFPAAQGIMEFILLLSKGASINVNLMEWDQLWSIMCTGAAGARTWKRRRRWGWWSCAHRLDSARRRAAQKTSSPTVRTPRRRGWAAATRNHPRRRIPPSKRRLAAVVTAGTAEWGEATAVRKAAEKAATVVDSEVAEGKEVVVVVGGVSAAEVATGC
jgi:hypothetical protein